MGKDAIANTPGLAYPFFAIEEKGDVPTGSGSLWVATNQCLGDASTCAETLNKRLQKGGLAIHQIDTHSFSVVLNGSEARLLVS